MVCNLLRQIPEFQLKEITRPVKRIPSSKALINLRTLSKE